MHDLGQPVSPARFAEAIGRVLDREDQAMRQRGYASLGPQADIFDAFVKRREKGEQLAARILHELAQRG